MKLTNIGFGNIVSSDRIIAVISPESAPVKRIITEAREKGLLIDATYGRKTKSVIICDSEHIILSGIVTEVIVSRLGKNQLLTPEEDRIDD
ncbi:MAG: DUF370 domain-containing protein [Clostridia bacterium]|nr:DUF370 domain-containing protein [Clostridia bacterium]